MRKGFFVPNSVSSSYVTNQKTAEGSQKWDQAAGEIGLGQQVAFQALNKQYSTTINDAYSQYLSANRGIRGSMMGEGYKAAYQQNLEQSLIANVAETNLSAATARAQIAQQGATQKQGLEDLFKTEVANMDRVSQSMNDYLGYVKSLTGSTDASKTYLTEDQAALTLDDMYDTLYNAQPRDYLDAEGNIGMSYIEWVNSNLKDNERDTTWSQWLFGQGGFQQFREATKKGVKK